MSERIEEHWVEDRKEWRVLKKDSGTNKSYLSAEACHTSIYQNQFESIITKEVHEEVQKLK